MEKERMASLVSALTDCLVNYTRWGARSNKRIIPLHAFIAEALDNPVFEKKVAGAFYNKNVDIFEPSKNHAYEVKLILSNYSQNANNYFESMLGATANLQANGVQVTQLVFLPTYLPYLDRQGRIRRIERVEHQIEKYDRLMSGVTGFSRPSELVFQLFDTGNLDFLIATMESGEPLDFAKLEESYSVSLPSEFSDFLDSHSYSAFLKSRM